MATDDEDFPLINDPSSHQHRDSHSANEDDFYPSVTGSAPDEPTPNSKRHQSVYYNVVKRQKPSSSNAEIESTTMQAMDYRSSSGGDYRKDREEWSDTAIACLLEAYTEKYNQLNRGNLRGRDWEDVAEAVSERGIVGSSRKSVEQCKNKIDNLKKRYKVELQRVSGSGSSGSSWHWFKHIELIMGSSNGKGTCGGDNDGAWGDNANNGGSNGGNVVPIRQPKRSTASNSPYPMPRSKPMSNLRWRRVVFKISGSALAGSCENVDQKIVLQVAKEVSIACRVGLQVAIVIGGGNLFCGDSWVSSTGLDRSTAYQIGMMGAVMNSILLQSLLEKLGVQTRVQSAFMIPELVEPYNKNRAIRHLEKGRVVIFGGVGAGAGNPLFSTDSAAAFRASELNAEAVLKGTNVDGVCDCNGGNDSVVDHISFREVLASGFASMDSMAITYCEENGLPVVVFNLLGPGNISRALCGEQVGTLIDQNGRIG